jgi:2-dehydro-3-deoxyphosphogluconate aldolase/(4S)-4-hydroxy-2-oxoglutarate aldolase
METAKGVVKIQSVGLLAVLRGPSEALTIQMVEALIAGGVRGIEITYSTPHAPQVVQALRARYAEQILLGMGTLTEIHQPAEALAAGAEFIVSPHYDAGLAEAMRATGLVFMMGALSPTEVFQAHKAGADIVKVFPGSLVGPAYLKSLHGPYPHIPLMPSGGVNVENIPAWFSAGAVAVSVGSELCSAELAIQGRFDEIERRARQFVAAVATARGGKV